MTRRRPVPRTLWTAAEDTDRLMLDYTVGEDRLWDMRLLPWDVYGSLGHAAGLRASGLLTPGAYARLRAGLRRALRAVEDGALVVDLVHEDAHSAVEDWLTQRHGIAGEQLHTGRSRNDQVACDLRLFLKQHLLDLHESACDLAEGLLGFAARHRGRLWPGYTHTRRAMPSSVGLWSAAYAEGLLDTIESLPALWARVDRSPLGSAAGYGVPLPLDREATARALGFASVEHNVAAVQLGRGKLEAAVLAWCGELGHDLARLSSDVILFSAEEYGYLILPPTRHRVEHHATQAEPRLVRTHPRPCRLDPWRPRHGPACRVATHRRLPPGLPAPQGAALPGDAPDGGGAGDDDDRRPGARR